MRDFTIETGTAFPEEKTAGKAVIVYMDKIFCHKLHGSAYQ